MIVRSKKKEPVASPQDLARHALSILQLPAVGETSEEETPPPEEAAPVAPAPAPAPPKATPGSVKIVQGVLEDPPEESEPEQTPPAPEGNGPGISIAGDLTLPFEVVTQSIGIVAARGSGKALALDTPIPTPSGWTTMGELSEGDVVFDETGAPCKVIKATDVMYGHDCYEVRFSDGQKIVADAEHLWEVGTIASRRADRRLRRGEERNEDHARSRPQCQRRSFPVVRATAEIRSSLRSKGGDLNYSVSNAGALDLPDIDLPIHPYVLGSWLGNGTAQNATITTADPETLEKFRTLGYAVGEPYNPSKNGVSWTYRIGEGPDGVPLQTHLRKLGLLLNKRLPPVYLRASGAQRRELLAGFMDTDGTIGKVSNMVTFGNMNRNLADAVFELAVSLGWTARIGTRRAKLNGVDYGEFYNVSFTPTENVFRVQRKAARVRTDATQRSRHSIRMIRAVTPTASVPVRCIAVDSPNRLYLAGRAMIPTHNTYLTTVLAEEFLFAGLPFVVIDPIGVYWGLRSGADGQSEGLDVYILGGEYGDVPLDPSSGRAVARWLLDYRAPAVLDLSLMRKAEQRVFVADLAEELYALSKLPLHLIVDEADLFIPQRASPDEKRVLAAFEDIVRRGRSRGLGITVVTQRPAVIHKDILTQIGTLIVLRMLGPQDRKSIEDWIKFHGDSAKQRMVLASLASLPIGTAWVWSPGWLGILKRVSIRRKITFDSSATPKAGEEIPPPNYRNELDVDALRVQLSDAIENDPNDPAVLKARIVELETALGEGGGGASLVAKLQKRVAELEHKLVTSAPKIKAFDPGAFLAQVTALGETVQRIEQGLQTAGVLVIEGEVVSDPGGPAASRKGKKR